VFGGCSSELVFI